MPSASPLTVRLDGTDPDEKRREILHYFRDSWQWFEALFDVLADDSVFYRQSEPTRHPMIFYFGHTAVFFVNKLILAKVIDARIDPAFESLFAVGVDEMQWDDLQTPYPWPEVFEVRRYRAKVKALVESLIETLPLVLPITQESPWWVILMGIEHERIHIETSSVLHRQMPLEYVKESGHFTYSEDSGEAPRNRLVPVPGATVELGKPRNHFLYGWDNEYGHRVEDVADFEAGQYLVSNAEYLEFVEAGGYETLRYWDEEGQAFLRRSQAKHPPFWIPDGQGAFRFRLLEKTIDFPYDWPVEVNCLEAEAFCRYKSEKEARTYRLPTEAEWYRMLELADVVKDDIFDAARANLNFAHVASSVPVNRFAHGAFFDIVGNVWQWTATPIDGFEGFEPHPVYDDFSTPTFDAKHNLIKGGSWASTGNEITRHSRYAFRRHFYQHAGFRYVCGAPIAKQAASNTYETDEAVAQYCEFQYGPEYFGVRNFARTCAEYAIDFSKTTPQRRALDLGCATGRASFELARVFDDVTGADFSARFIQVGVQMRDRGEISYARVEEGEITTMQTHTRDEFDLDFDLSHVQFWQADACNLKPQFSGYDLILATNLIDRLYEPALFLDTVHERLNEGGVLVLTSPYTWLETYTKKAHWIGGYYDETGRPVETLEGLKRHLLAHFMLVSTLDVPFVIRETARKYQHTVAQMSVWKKKG